MGIDPLAQADLARQLAAIAGRAAMCRSYEIAGDIEALRRSAVSAGLFPAAGVAHAIAGALSTSAGHLPIDGWLAILADAIASGRSDPAACEAFAALCSVRLTG